MSRLPLHRSTAIVGTAALLLVGAGLAGCSTGPAAGGTATGTATNHSAHDMKAPDEADLDAARSATSGFADLAAAESAGYASTMADLGCFQDAEKGGMGLHYASGALIDDALDVEHPEALVYELDEDGTPGELVGLEYIVPIEAWESDEPPTLYGNELHKHGVLPNWILHAWVHRDNPSGVLADYNPDVAMCPDGVPVFGVDLPKEG